MTEYLLCAEAGNIVEMKTDKNLCTHGLYIQRKVIMLQGSYIITHILQNKFEG
jgi:hypothetical protein